MIFIYLQYKYDRSKSREKDEEFLPMIHGLFAANNKKKKNEGIPVTAAVVVEPLILLESTDITFEIFKRQQTIFFEKKYFSFHRMAAVLR
ncbi:hypothetical protein TNCV_3147341 [Trichonephila clavipes]|nr:hypothetical protein TNCV_3147341 [Trichonephila clavipes]